MPDALIDVTGPRLRRLFHLLAGAFLLASVLAMTWLSAGYLERLRAEYLDQWMSRFERQAGQLDLHLMRANSHILRMRLLGARALANAALPAAPALEAVASEGRTLGYSLDRLGGANQGPIGNVFSADPPESPELRREVDMVNAVFGYLSAQHTADPALRWSHYTSIAHRAAAFYPFLRLDELLRESGTRDLDDFFGRAFDTASRESMRQEAESADITWSRFYVDQAGAGNVVTAFGPVRLDGRLVGAFGADISIDAVILRFLRENAVADTELRLTNRKGGGYVSSVDGVVTDELPVPQTFTGWRSEGADLLASIELHNAPFLLQLRVPKAMVLEPVDTIAQGLRLLGALMVVLFLGAWLLATRYFVQPSLELAAVVLEGRDTDAARLPALWTGVLARLREARRERERLHAELRREHELLERRVEQRTADLARLNAELQAYNHAVSHDLRAPARSMSGFATLLREDYGERLDGEALAYLQRIERGAQRMSEMIDALTRLSRLERHELQCEDVDLSRMCEDVLEALQRNESAPAPAVSVEPGLHAHADPALLRSVLENLLGNAWKFSSRTPDARIRVYAERREGRDFVCVEDNGAGFDGEQAERLFAPFQRAHSEQEFAGTGIGLSTVKRIVERHGGVVTASGNPGRGACFAFWLPAAQAGRA